MRYFLLVLFVPFISFAQSSDKPFSNASSQPFTKEGINRIRINTKGSKDSGFVFFCKYSDTIDKVMKVRNYSADVINYIENIEFIDPIWQNCDSLHTEPNWEAIERALKMKYKNRYTGYVLTDAKMRWFGYKNSWDQYTKWLIRRVDTYGPFALVPDEDFRYNSVAWDMFERGRSQAQLEKALEWSRMSMKLSTKPNAEYFDTYANILYKLGRVTEGISYEEKALSLAPDAADIKANLQKMREGRETWPVTSGQKSPLDTVALNHWPSVRDGIISDSGRYVAYYIETGLSRSRTLVVQSTSDSNKVYIEGGSEHSFVNEHFCVFSKGDDSIGVLDLKSFRLSYLSGAGAFKIPQHADNEEWISFEDRHFPRQLKVVNLNTNKEYLFKDVVDHHWRNDGQGIVIKVTDPNTNGEKESLSYVDLRTGEKREVLSNRKIGQILADEQAGLLAVVEDDSVRGSSFIWYYRMGDPLSRRLNQGFPFNGAKQICSVCLLRFSKRSDKIFAWAFEHDEPGKRDSLMSSVDVWSYKDKEIQSLQLKYNKFRSFLAVISLLDSPVVIIDRINEERFDERDDYVTVYKHAKGLDHSDDPWNNDSSRMVDIVSTSNGERRSVYLPKGVSWGAARLSPGGKYMVYYSPGEKNYFSYSIVENKTRNITIGSKNIWTYYPDDIVHHEGLSYPIVAWTEGDQDVLLYDRYDIWQVDLSGQRSPVNLTGGYGRLHNRIFRLASNGHGETFGKNQRILTSVFDNVNKDNGFSYLEIGKTSKPECLGMGPCVYDIPTILDGNVVKAKRMEAFIVTRMDVQSSSNYVYTTDFKKYTQISNVFPEKKYNWMRNELLTWKSLNGRTMQGILYKPEDFDPDKKYPVIFNYYEKKSSELNRYYPAEPSDGMMNIPWFVSRGYIVFVPDVYYEIGKAGYSAYSSVVSAALYLSKMKWVDKQKFGLFGHSFGGFETNYIVSHSTLFSAAISASAVSDVAGDYSTISLGGTSRQTYYEVGQGRMGATFWERPDVYIDNSPIFKADKIKTPLLLMNNKADGAVDFSQGVKLFLALRRQRKEVWMLQYDNGNHLLNEANDMNDFNSRITQFFNHYLKDTPAPKWMTRGIPATMKGIDNGLGLDLTNGESGM